MTKVLVLDNERGSYSYLWKDQGYEVVTKGLTEDVSLICFTGGTDISTKIYKEKKHPYTSSPDVARDAHEIMIFKEAVKHGIPMVGICRGAQLLCVMSGGKLFQHVSGHTKPHAMMTFKGDIIGVTSSHHQMMDLSPFENVPEKEKPQLLGWSSDRQSSTYIRGTGRDKDIPSVEPEVVFFPKFKSLAHQPHPEWMQAGAPYHSFFFNTVHTYLGV